MGACEGVEMCDEIRDVRGGGCGRRRGSGGDSVFRGGNAPPREFDPMRGSPE